MTLVSDGNVRKKGRPPSGQGTSVILRIHPRLLSEIDNWIGAQPGKKPTRQKAIYQALEEKFEVPNK